MSSSTKENIPSPYDSVHISLLTCSSHPEVYSLYGHTAIRYENQSAGQDFVINYGVFDFGDKWFVPKFTFGITDYSMGVVPYYYFEKEYQRYGSSITQQEINLTAKEKEAVTKAIEINYRSENRTYRYNYFYKNCSTMARDILVDNIDGKVIYPEAKDKMSFRDMIHSCNEGYPWARLGNDMLLGVRADLNTNTEERQFLPENLKNDFEGAVIVKDGVSRPLVKTTKVLLHSGKQTEMEGFPLSPLMCVIPLIVLCCIISLIEERNKKITLWFDAAMMALTGIAGILILLMFFSEHPTTSTNLLIFMLNPLPLFYLRKIFVAEKNKKKCVWWKIWAGMSVLTLISALFLQDIDKSMIGIALIILGRAVSHIRFERKMI